MKSKVKVDEEQLAKKRACFTVEIIPWFMGLSTDLLFYTSINTLFLTTAKHFTASQISLFITVSCLSYILLQKAIFKNNKGNRKY